jgi:hypothetical protein
MIDGIEKPMALTDSTQDDEAGFAAHGAGANLRKEYRVQQSKDR